MEICIFGSGAVGSAVGRGFSKLGHRVIFYDIDRSRVDSLLSEGFDATADSGKAVRSSNIIFICVPTPTLNKRIVLSYVRAAAAEIGRLLRGSRDYRLIVVKSTVPPGTCEGIVIPALEKRSGRKAGKDFGVCSNPEFLRENHAYDDFMNPDRIVIGQLDSRSGALLSKLYSGFSCPVIIANLRTSEMAKYANNTFYATKISFFNELALVCKSAGADSEQVRRIVQLDRFYATHPWSHGRSFGGRCLPKDLDALIEFASKSANPHLLKAVRSVNEQYAAAEALAVPGATRRYARGAKAARRDAQALSIAEEEDG
jgi:UDPglucose 6-dehydrogenase